MPLPSSFYSAPTLTVARRLLGMHLVHVVDGKQRIGRIVETEGYLGPRDLAAHSARGQTPRNAVMFGPAGHAYVYFIYGMWYCFNVVTHSEGVPHAVLIRAVEPVAHLESPSWGPGLLCRALGIDRSQNGLDLTGHRLWIEAPPVAKPIRIVRATRIGVDYAGDWAHKPWRFFVQGSPYVSTVPAAKRRRILAGA